MEEVTIIIDSQPHKVTKPVADFIVKLGKERNNFEDLVLWMTGCPYDFCKHEEFNKKVKGLFK